MRVDDPAGPDAVPTWSRCWVTCPGASGADAARTAHRHAQRRRPTRNRPPVVSGGGSRVDRPLGSPWQHAAVTHEREITNPVDLCTPAGRLHPEARGWSRRPQLRANLRRGWGRKKRWDYWCVLSDDVIASLVIADVDYAGLASCWVLERGTGTEASAGTLAPFGGGIHLPDQVCTGTASHRAKAVEVTIEERPDGTRLRAHAPSSAGGAIDIDVLVAKPSGVESLNVVIPWSDRLFQFTSKQNSRPATGTVTVGERTWQLGDELEAWGIQDLGRGIWPYSNRWNWAAATGRASDGRLVGLQFGGKWTVGTGATENALCIDGRLTKISDELVWDYSWDHPMDPWRVRSHDGSVDVTLTPTFDRYDSTDLKLLKMEVHQCFGTWSGRVLGVDGVPADIDGILGFAEEARNRW